MSYSLEILPDRGWVSLSPYFLGDGTYNHVPTSFGGFRHPISSTSFGPSFQGWKLFFKNNTDMNAYSDGRVNFNNTNLTLATKVSINSDFYSYNYQENDFIIFYKFSNTYNFVIYNVINSVKDTSKTPDQYIIDIEYVSGSISSFTDAETIIIQRGNNNTPSWPSSWFGTPTQPLIINGDQNAINNILQNPTIINWTDKSSTFTVYNGQTYGTGEFSIPTINTNDPLLSFTIIKDGIQYDPYVVHLKYKTPQQKNNPNNYP